MPTHSGHQQEQFAKRYLEQQGLKQVATNFSCRLGEIDLIMVEGDTLLFIEVKSRSSRAYGHAMEFVTANKQKKLIKTAQYFLMKYKKWQSHYCRFDVVAIDSNTATQQNHVNWIKNAFQITPY